MRQATWTRDAIIAAIRDWAEAHGRQPSGLDWFYAGYGHPAKKTVYERFGSWNAAIAAAGFTPQQVGRRGQGPTQVRVLAALNRPRRVREVQDELGLTPDSTYWHLANLTRIGLAERVGHGVYLAVAA